jgi:hypothetical protein
MQEQDQTGTYGQDPYATGGSVDEVSAEAGALIDEPLPGEQAGGEGGPSAGDRGREWLQQLESMINGLATQAAPIARQVAAKAAELTAVAAERAGPFAHKAADATTEAGHKLAERANQLASDLRRQQAEEEAAGTSTGEGEFPGDESRGL